MTNNWLSLNNKNELVSLIQLISTLDNSNVDSWVKWKTDADNQVVIKTNNYVYKLYSTHKNSDKVFDFIIRNTLSDIYSDYGIHWKIKTFDVGNNLYQLEQREIITECTPSMMSFGDLLLNWKQTLDELEKRLNFKKISYQLRDYLIDNSDIKVLKNINTGTEKYCEDSVTSIKLIRNCINKYKDYGIKDGKVILFDDADWTICLVNSTGDLLSLRYDTLRDIPIIFQENQMYLQPINVVNTIQSHLLFNDLLHNKFNLIYKQECDQTLDNINIKQLKDDMFNINTKLLTTGLKPDGSELSLLNDVEIIRNLTTNNGNLSSIIYQEGI